jgi:hypothetical protein
MNRVTYRHSGVSEWYHNGPFGLEQGFDIFNSHGGHAADVVLSLSLSGAPAPLLSHDGRDVFLVQSRSVSLGLSQLSATDVTGRELPIRFSLGRHHLRITIDANGAQYPLHVDPFVQTTPKLTASGEMGAGGFGGVVAISADGNTAVFGAGGEESYPEIPSAVGAAYVFVRSGSTWTQQARLTGAGEIGGGAFGAAVAISADGNTIAVGGPYDGYTDNRSAHYEGGVWIYSRAGGHWAQQEKLVATDSQGKQTLFGEQVALSSDGSTLLIGGPGDNTGQGAAWVFVRSGSTWAEQAKLVSGAPSNGGFFGSSGALSAAGDKAVVLEPFRPVGPGQLEAVVRSYSRSGTTWTEDPTALTAAACAAPSLASPVLLSYDGNTLLVGGGTGGTGACVFSRKGAAWKLEASLAGPENRFPPTAALSGDGTTVLLGDPWANEKLGAVRSYFHVGLSWFEDGEFEAEEQSRPPNSLTFPDGMALSQDGSVALIGASGDGEGVGAAWAFEANGVRRSFALGVSLAGSGSGSVSGPGILCPSSCSSTYPRGTPVTLTASPAAGSTFAGWGGTCSGTGACTVTVGPGAFVTATFITTPPGPTGTPPDCTDMASISPGFLSTEETLFKVRALSLPNVPVAVTAGVKLGSVGVCSRAVTLLTNGFEFAPPGVSFITSYDPGSGQTQSPTFTYSVLPLGWQPLPPGTGAPNARPPVLDWTNSLKYGVEIRPSLDMTYRAGGTVDAGVDIINVKFAQDSTTLIVLGKPFLEMSLGPEVSIGLVIDKEALAKDVATDVAEGMTREAAAQAVANEVGTATEEAVSEEVGDLAPGAIAPAGQAEIVSVAATVDESAAVGLAADASEAALLATVDSTAIAADLVGGAALDGAADDIAGSLLLDFVEVAILANKKPGPELVESDGRPKAPARLAGSPLRHLRLASLRRARFPRGLIPTLIRERLDMPVPARVRPLVVTSARLRAGRSLGVIAPHLGIGKRHDALLTLAGPGGFRATRLLAVAHGFAGVNVDIPRTLPPGTWTISVQDMSKLGYSHHRFTGSATIDMGVFTVPRHRRP